ncbi:MAG: adenosylcobinamide amidohydrolase [Treponema sp.]|jgi:hypothetical protein|nr:adenosylcobinamide amidohydrolase [Treponema sp.]
MTVLTKLNAGEEVRCYRKSIMIPFAGKRRVLSASPHNGGYREYLTAVFNSDCTIDANKTIALLAPACREHMTLFSAELELDPEINAALNTSSWARRPGKRLRKKNPTTASMC